MLTEQGLVRFAEPCVAECHLGKVPCEVGTAIGAFDYRFTVQGFRVTDLARV
jgi:hypothetical protein